MELNTFNIYIKKGYVLLPIIGRTRFMINIIYKHTIIIIDEIQVAI